jgi:hypothetical protein
VTFYTYLWLREDGTPYYIGKGHGRRAFISACHTVRRPPTSGRIIVLHASTEQEAFDKEVELIAQFGRKDLGTGCLRNRTKGGDGVSGHVPTAKQRLAVSLANRRRKPADLTDLHEGNRGNQYALGHHWTGKHKRHVSHDSNHQLHALHVRWHVNRGVVKAGCSLCQ